MLHLESELKIANLGGRKIAKDSESSHKARDDRMSKVESQLAENTQQLGELAKMLKSFMSAKQPEMAEASNSASKHAGKEEADAHNDWVSCVRFSPSALAPVVVSDSWDSTVKVWDLDNCKLRYTLTGHNGYVNAVAVSPDGSICASGGKDGVTLLWDVAEGECLYSFDAGAIIHSLCFHPNRYWLCVATENSVKIWDLESKSIVQDLKSDQPLSKNQMLYCTSLNWSVDGNTLFTGCSDGTIRVWAVTGTTSYGRGRGRKGRGGADRSGRGHGRGRGAYRNSYGRKYGGWTQ